MVNDYNDDEWPKVSIWLSYGTLDNASIACKSSYLACEFCKWADYPSYDLEVLAMLGIWAFFCFPLPIDDYMIHFSLYDYTNYELGYMRWLAKGLEAYCIASTLYIILMVIFCL